MFSIEDIRGTFRRSALPHPLEMSIAGSDEPLLALGARQSAPRSWHIGWKREIRHGSRPAAGPLTWTRGTCRIFSPSSLPPNVLPVSHGRAASVCTNAGLGGGTATRHHGALLPTRILAVVNASMTPGMCCSADATRWEKTSRSIPTSSTADLSASSAPGADDRRLSMARLELRPLARRADRAPRAAPLQATDGARAAGRSAWRRASTVPPSPGDGGAPRTCPVARPRSAGAGTSRIDLAADTFP